MANYSLIINSKFKPFSYQELLHPVLASTQAHQQIDEAYTDLATKANKWDKLANEQTDPKAHALYKKYADDLKVQADELATSGLNPSSRRTMLNMRSRYSTDILPIEQAFETRKKQADAQAEILAKDPTHFFAREAATTSLDKFLDNPSLDTLKENYSGALLTQQVSQAASALAKSARNDPDVQATLKEQLAPYQYELIRQKGFSPQAVWEVIMNNPKANRTLLNLVDNAIADSGMANWNYISPESKERIMKQARAYANQGLWSAVGETSYDKLTDEYGMKSALNAQEFEYNKRLKTLNTPTLPEEPSRGWNFLEANGTLAEYNELQNNLTLGGGSLKSKYFGHKFVNPIALYEEAAKKFPDVKGKVRLAASSTPGSTASYKASSASVEEKRAKYLKDKYGVTKLTSKEYELLKDLGYTNTSTFDDFRNNYSRRVNERASQWRHGSVNLNESALKERGNNLAGYLQFIDDHNITENQLWEMNKDGSTGKPVKHVADLKLAKDPKLTDVFYTRQAPDKIQVQYGGRDFYVTPSAFSNDVIVNIINESNRLLTAPDNVIVAYARALGVQGNVTAEQIRDVIAKNTEGKLKDAMRAYGQGVPNTSSDLIK